MIRALTQRSWQWGIALLLVVVGVFALSVSGASAQAAPDTLGLNNFEQTTVLSGQDIRVTIARIINVFLSVIGVLALIIVLYGGFIYMTSGGNEEKIARARKILINGGIGLIIIFASWSVTKFVLTRLQTATGTAVQSTTASSTTRITQQFNCTLNPTWCCAQNNFIVQSITPRSDSLQMNNGVVRAVFSRSIKPPADLALQIFRDSVRVDNEFTIAFADASQRVVQATYSASSTCSGAPGCMPPGNYMVRVQDVRDNNNNQLQTNPSCGAFPRDAQFTVTANGVTDTVAPTLPLGMTINGVQQQNQPLAIGRFASTSIAITDASGAGYLRLAYGPENRPPDVVVYDGPPVSRGSDAPASNPYLFRYPLSLSPNLIPLRRYVIQADVYDVDNNVRTVSSSFVTVADHCFNNRQDGDETGVDVGGSCLSVGSCTANWQCASGSCTQGQCRAIPIINRVDPWDGAAGNWVTIYGRFFGDTNGQVAFGYDQNGDGTVTGTEWQATALAQCNGADVWKDDWIIAQIPSDTQLPQGTTSSIRVTRANNVTYFDTTINARGPRGGPNNGLFTKSTTDRPGICRVETTATGATAATPRTPVRVLGQGFGSAGTLSFGGQAVPTGNWSAGLISATVPESLQPGFVGVNVRSGGQVSNGFPFQILDPGQNLNPVIDTITPVTVSNNSLITLSGQGFGNRVGRVFLTTNANSTCTPQDVANGVCLAANTTLDAACGDTWSAQQVIVQVVGVTTSAQYFVRLRNAAGFQTSDNNDTVNVNVTAAPTPGICRINPAQGPAPRASLRITGVNFTSPASVHFWSPTAAQNPTTIAAWPVFATGNQVAIANRRSLTTPIPITTTGETMQSGPVYVQTSGGLSNAANYSVLDCRQADPSTAPQGFHCCDDGSYRPNNVACPGQTRDAGYVWRFTTGKTPNYPYVIEQCRNGGPSPSPSPSQQWDSGRPACINALIRVRFNLDMDPLSVQNGIRVYTCGGGLRPDCSGSTKQDVTPQFTIVPLTRGAQISANSGRLASNMWYHVELLNTVQSQHTEVVLAQNTIVNEPLRRTNPCGRGTAFCFDFQTDDQICRLANAFIEPPTKRTTYLGMIQDARYPLSFTNPLNVPNPFYFYLWGKADRDCVVLPVDGLGWQWGPTAVTAPVTAAPAPSPGSRQIFTDSRGAAIARQNTFPQTVDIQAVTGTIRATSSIMVDLGDPKVIDYWPNCVESCTNANIGMQFSTYMLTSTYPGAVTIQRCLDPLCAQTTGVNLQYNVVTADPTIFRIAPVQQLVTSTWYQVAVDNTARAATALGSSVPGNPLTPFSWRFRTKAQDGFCIAGQVIVEPNPFTARAIGQKTPYRAIPYSSPNQCNTRGQGLNPWAYGWQWQTQNRAGTPSTLVASVTQFQTIAAPKPFCTQGCVPAGADVRRGQTAPPLCGDGLVDRREDCDIAGTFVNSSGATVPEVAGTTCSLRCQRPGSTAATCGDGQLQREFGEECDPGTPGSNPANCSATCQFEGSVPESQFDGAVRQSFCGDTVVDADSGEECDIEADANGDGIPDEIPDVTCSSQTCLRLGNNNASQNWCTQNATAVINAGGTQARQTQACLNAVSVCGNGVVENGELCEVITRDPTTGAGTIRLFGQGNTAYTVADTDICTTQCLLENICNQNAFPPTLVCTAQEGCRPTGCTFAGSSLGYSAPSLCGDGVTGIGELAMCEYQAGEYNPTALLGLDPVQVVTAIGQGQVNASTSLQEALVEARAVQVQRTPTQRQTIDVAGRGQYALQCGYTEYPTQQVINGAQRYNDCPANANNTIGVGYNSCCYARPTRTREYPADGTGLTGSGSLPVCVNTYIDVEYSGDIDAETAENNIILARGYATATNCSSGGQVDVTNMVTGTIARADIDESRGLFRRMWDGLRGFFRGLFGRGAYATTQRPAIVTWCAGEVTLTPDVRKTTRSGQVVSSTIRLSINKALKENTTYAVVVKGGIRGVRDVRGVGIRPQRAAGTDDSWVFQTDPTGRICEIDKVTITPSSYVFTRPNSSTRFVVDVFDDTDLPLQAVPNVYDWQTTWGPTNHAAFAVPSVGTATSPTIQIGSRTVEGKVTGFANLTITDNLSTNVTGTVYSGTTNLRALFCENLWPPRQYYPYEDGFPRNAGPNNDGYNTTTRQFDGSANAAAIINGSPTYFNFSTGYCADAGNQSTTTDDLPYLRPLVFIETPAPGSATTPQRLTAFGSLQNDGSGRRVFNMPRDVVVQGDRAYVTSYNSHSLEIIDITNRANPQLLNRFIHAGDPTSYFKAPSALAVQQNFVYALAGGTGNGSLQIIDVRDEQNPRFRGWVLHSPTAQPHLYGAKDIVVVGNYAYVTVSGFELRSNGLQVFDVSNPDNPIPAGYINHGSLGARLYGANGLFVSGNYAYITVTGFGFEGMQIIDISNPQQLRPAGFIGHTSRAPMIGAEDVFVTGNNAYVAVSGQSSGGVTAVPVPALSIIDVTDPNNPQPRASVQHGAPALLDGANNVVVVNNIAYVTAANSRAVTAINVADPSNPTHIHSLPASPTPPQMYFNQLTGMWVSGGYVVTVSDRSGSLEIIDTSTLVATAPASPTGQVRLPQEIRKRYLFTNAKNNDAVGIQVFDNVARESARTWFEARHGSSENFQTVIVGGFDAISDGNNLYINFLNQGAVPNDIDNYILLLSVNEDAQDETRRVYDQLVDNLEFLINVTDVGYCSVGDNSNPQNVFTPDAAASVQCRTDFDCVNISGRNRICANAKTKLLRDWQRVADVQLIQEQLRTVAAGARYPQLQSGTFYQQYTNSRWPSWNQTLAAQVRSPQLPPDPVNEWTSCGTRDPQTCWDPQTATFLCPALTSVYEYVASSTGAQYTLHVPFEYFTPSGGVISQLLDTNFLSFNRWCQASTTYSPFARSCGDGIVNTTVATGQTPEQCDPPGQTRVRAAAPADGCAPGERVQETCSASCTYAQSQCIAQATCGNGVVEPGEQCDDGTLNGRYGQCAGPNSEPAVPRCQGPHPAFCGDGTPNFTDTRPADGYRDAGTTAEEFCEIADPRFANQGFCQKRSCLNLTLGGTSQDIPGPLFFTRAVHAASPNAVWAAGELSGFIGEIHFYDGSSWTRQYNGGANNTRITDITFVDAVNGWASGELAGSGVVLRTGDGGQTWTPEAVPGATGMRFEAVDFVSPQFGVAMGNRGGSGAVLAVTNDGGQTWTSSQLSGGPMHDVDFVNERVGWAVGPGGLILFTNDGGQTWTPQQQNITTGALRDVEAESTSVVYIGGITEILSSVDGGTSWQDVTVPPALLITPTGGTRGNTTFDGMSFSDAYTGLVNAALGRVYGTNDGGRTWRRIPGISFPNALSNDVYLLNDQFGVSGGSGNHFQILNSDPYCQGVTTCTNNAACQSGDVCLAATDPSYHPTQGNSCALSCREAGGYCGDGVVNQQYEECEPNDPNCTLYCLTRTRPQIATPGVQTGCGNGIIDAGEQCDNGLRNGQVCTAGYGQNCTYCSSQCVTLTRDATAFCGDGVLQRNEGEVCDVGPTPGTIISWNGTTQVTQACTGGQYPGNIRGEYTCIDNCRRIESTCTVCGFVEQCACDAAGNDTGRRQYCADGRDNDGDGLVDCRDTTGGGAVPQLAILNPMIGSEAASYVSTSWGAQTFFDLLRPDLTKLPASTPSQWNEVQGWLVARVVSGPNYIDYRQSRSVVATNRSGGPLISNALLNTDPQCRDAYKLDVNSRFILDSQAQSANPSDLIPYPVNAEPAVIRNEVVMSPPVPENVFRVVVRWGADEFNAGARFIGRAYNNAFSTQNARIADYTRALTAGNVCTNITRQQQLSDRQGNLAQYWWPATGNCTPFDGVAYIHPRIASSTLFSNTFVQAMTLDLRDPNIVSSTVHFFVDELSGPIRPYERNQTLVVDVYEYKIGQNTLRGHYNPITFPITAAAGTSSNPTDEYWHVFNLVRTASTGKYRIVPVQQIERDVQDVLRNR